jgi:hypothetical protein
VLGALIIWLFQITMYKFDVPYFALLAGKAMLAMVVILLCSDHARRFLRIKRNGEK